MSDRERGARKNGLVRRALDNDSIRRHLPCFDTGLSSRNQYAVRTVCQRFEAHENARALIPVRTCRKAYEHKGTIIGGWPGADPLGRGSVLMHWAAVLE